MRSGRGARGGMSERLPESAVYGEQQGWKGLVVVTRQTDRQADGGSSGPVLRGVWGLTPYLSFSPCRFTLQ